MSKFKTHHLQLIWVIVLGVAITTMNAYDQAMQIRNEVATAITNE
jgi:hypothetical protein